MPLLSLRLEPEVPDPQAGEAMKQLLCNPIDLEWAEHMKPEFEKDTGRALEIWVDETCPPGNLYLPDTNIDTSGMRRPA